MTALTLNSLSMVSTTANRLAHFASLAWFAHVAKRVRYELGARAAIARLNNLDDRILEDIGLRRCDIAAVVRGQKR